MKLYRIEGKGIFTHSKVNNNNAVECRKCALYIKHTTCKGVETWYCNELGLPEGSHFVELDQIKLLSFLLEEIKK